MKRTCIAQLATGLAVCLSPQIVTVVADNLFVGDFNTGNIYQFNTVLGGGASQTTFATGLVNPGGLAFDSSGVLYAANNSADIVNGRIVQFASDGSYTTYASGVQTPTELAFDGAGNLKVGGGSVNTIYNVSPSGVVSTFATLPAGSNAIHGQAYDASGTLYVANGLDNGSIREYDSTGTFLTTFASNIDGPFAVIVDKSSGDVYVDSTYDGVVWKFNSTGTTKTQLASGLSLPTGMALDSQGNLFVADAGTGTIYEISPSDVVTSFATGLNQPWSMAFEPVPEPSTWALLGVGVGVIALGLRKNRS